MIKMAGISVDPEREKHSFMNDYPLFSNWTIVETGLTRKEALDVEADLLRKGYKVSKGSDYPDNGKMPYTVFTFEA